MNLFYNTGTRWKREKQLFPPRPKEERNEELEKLFNGEADGDLFLAVIMAARNILQKPGSWTGECRAMTSKAPCEATSVHAVQWSIHGALEKATYPFADREMLVQILYIIRSCLPDEYKFGSLSRWESMRRRKHSEVLALLNRAIAARKRELGYAKT